MARRRRGEPKLPVKPFESAFAGIDALEARVIHHMVDAPFSPENFVRWMYPDDVVDKLQAAYPVIREQDRTSVIRENLTLPVVWPSVTCQFLIDTKSVRMCVPRPGLARAAYSEHENGIILTLVGAFEQHLRFEKVREVVRWLNAHATVGAARHYCPWMTSILPADHEFQNAGQLYREPKWGMSEIMPTMRECGSIMAAALLCGEIVDGKDSVGVRFEGRRTDWSGTIEVTGTYVSENFWIV